MGSMALRRARTAIRMLEQGAGQSGVRVDVAMGLLRSVQAVAEVRTAVEAAYGEAIRKRSSRSAAGLALALQAVDSSEAPAALLRGYARADTVLASRLRRALMECDPADLRAQDELLEALPRSRRQALQIG